MTEPTRLDDYFFEDGEPPVWGDEVEECEDSRVDLDPAWLGRKGLG